MSDIEKYLKLVDKKSYDEKAQSQLIKKLCQAKTIDVKLDQDTQKNVLNLWDTFLKEFEETNNFEATKLRLLYIIIFERINFEDKDSENYLNSEFLTTLFRTVQLLMDHFVPRRISLYFVLKAILRLFVRSPLNLIQFLSEKILFTNLLSEFVLPFIKSQTQFNDSDDESHLAKFDFVLNFLFESLKYYSKKNLIDLKDETLAKFISEPLQLLMWTEDSQKMFVEKINEINKSSETFSLINEETLANHMEKFRASIIRFYRELFIFDTSKSLVQIKINLKMRYSHYNTFLSGGKSSVPYFFLNKEGDIIQIIDLIYQEEFYPLNDQTLLSDFLWRDLMRSLDCPDITTGKFSVRIFTKILNSLAEHTKKADKKIKQGMNNLLKPLQTFIDLFLTLDCYASHLIKELWKQLLSLLALKIDSYTELFPDLPILKNIKVNELVGILLNKATRHNNLSVRKFCIKSFLTFPVDFPDYEDFIYTKLFEILNAAYFYKDVPLDGDSKFYSNLHEFFVTFYKKLDGKKLEEHLKMFLTSLGKNITYSHPYVGFGLILAKIAKTQFFGINEMQIYHQVRAANYHDLPLRKKIQAFNNFSTLLFRHLNFKELNSEFFSNIIYALDDEILQLKCSPSTQELLKTQIITFPEEQVLEWLTQQDLFGKEKIFFWLMKIPSDIFSVQKFLEEKKAFLLSENQKSEKDITVFFRLLSITALFEQYTENPGNLELSFKLGLLKENIFDLKSLLLPFFDKLKNFYNGSYKSHNDFLERLLFLKEILANVFQEQGNPEMQKFLRIQVSEYSEEVFSYLTLKVTDSEEEFKDLVFNFESYEAFVSKFFGVCISNNFLNESKKLSERVSKFIKTLQELLQKTIEKVQMNPSLLKEEKAFQILNLSMKLLRNIINCFNEETVKLIKQGCESVYVDSGLFESGLDILNALMNINKVNEVAKDTVFQNNSSMLINDYIMLLKFDKEIFTSEGFSNFCQNHFDDPMNLVDSFNINAYSFLFKTLDNIYIAHFVNLFLSKNHEERSAIADRHVKLVRLCADSLVDNAKWVFSYKEIKTLTNFALNDELFLHEEFLKHELPQRIVQNLIAFGRKAWLLHRAVVDTLFSVFYRFPEIMIYFVKEISKITRLREYKGYESNVYFEIEEDYMPLIKETKKRSPSNFGFFGTLPRYIFLRLFELNAINFNKYVQSSVPSETEEIPRIKNLIHFFFAISINLLDYNYREKVNNFKVMPYSDIHRKKLYVWQTLLVLKRVLNAEIAEFCKKQGWTDLLKKLEEIKQKAWDVMQINHLPTVRQYVETFVLHLLKQFPQDCMPIISENLKNRGIKSQFAISLVFVSGYFMCYLSSEKHSRELFDVYFPFITSNVAYLRAVSQFFVFTYISENKRYEERNDLKELYQHFTCSKEAIQLKQKVNELLNLYKKTLEEFELSSILTCKFDEFGEITHSSIVEDLKKFSTEFILQIKNQEQVPPRREDLWRMETQKLIDSLGDVAVAQNTNYQRKIDSIISEGFQYFSLKEKKRKAADIIVIGTLVDKIPNLANLTRTCEVFGVSQLTIPNKSVLEDDAFKIISVTADRWMPLLEVREKELMGFLLLKKQLGYKLIGLEQTNESKSLENFNFPEKCVLLLGKEKVGIPIEYIEMLDSCVEIPQFGHIRSLNVHISAVICVWEFVKQNFIGKK